MESLDLQEHQVLMADLVLLDQQDLEVNLEPEVKQVHLEHRGSQDHLDQVDSLAPLDHGVSQVYLDHLDLLDLQGLVEKQAHQELQDKRA